MNEYDKEPTIDFSDEELIQLAEKWMQESEIYHNELLRVQVKNEKYYLGDQTEKDMVPAHSSDVVENHIFMGTETIVPIATANTPQWVVAPGEQSEVSADFSTSVEEILKEHYEDVQRDVRRKIKDAFRHEIIYRYGALKIFWDEEIDDVNVKVVRPTRLWFPKYGQSVDELPYIIEKVDMTFKEIEEVFGKDMLEKVRGGTGEEISDRQKVERTITVWEVWVNDFVFWRAGNHILRKQANPYFNFDGRTGSIDEFGNSPEDTNVNHFRKPRKPYIFITEFLLGLGPVGDTSIIEQAIPIQDIINIHKRAIVDSARMTGNPVWLVDSQVGPLEEIQNQITNEPGLLIYGPGAANPNLLRRDAPPPIPNYIIASLQEAQAAFDNIFGTHSTTRGERREPETLGGRLLLKQADIGRIDLLVREIERVVTEIGNWWLQLMVLFYEKERTFKIFGENGVKFVSFSRMKFQQGMRLKVKAGSTLPTDDMSTFQNALTLFQLGALDPLTLYERMKFPDPEGTLQRLIQWQAGQAQQTLAMEQQKEAFKSQAQGAAAPQPGAQAQLQESQAGFLRGSRI